MTLPPNSEKSLQLHFQAKKIRDFNGSDLRNLHLSILAICKLIGVTEAPEDAVIKLLIEHLQEHHRDFSIEEIKRAFSLATAGKLNFEFNHWNRITPQLLSMTLNKYKEQRNKDLLLFNNEQEKIKKIESSESGKPSDEEMQRRYVNSAINLFEAYKIQKNQSEPTLIPVHDYGNIVYKFLDRIGCIELTTNEKTEIYKVATDVVIERLKQDRKTTINDIKRVRKEASEKCSFEVAKESMHIALSNFFENLLDSNVDLKELISSKLSLSKTS